jgi:3-oxoacyl-[acyl-carrier-protein] synthase II
MESSFPTNIALAAAAVARGRLFPPLDAGEAPMEGPLSAALITGWGHWRGESSAVVDRAS